MPGEVNVEQLVLALSDDLEDFASPLVMVLDDYHLISHDSPVHEFISWFLQHPLQNLHWVLVTRHDPPLPLATCGRVINCWKYAKKICVSACKRRQRLLSALLTRLLVPAW